MSWYSPEKLRYCWQQIRKKNSAGGLDQQSVEDFTRHTEQRLTHLFNQLNERSYLPQPGKLIHLAKSDGGSRPISLASIEDKIVQMALKLEIEPRFERIFLDTSYAYRQRKGHRKAISRVKHYLSQKATWVTTCDIDNFFDSIDHQRLLAQLPGLIEDEYQLELIQLWLKIGAFKGEQYVEARQGVPQGSVISPLLSNLYLHPFDVEMQKCGAGYVRYADDFIILAKKESDALSQFEIASTFLTENRGLRLNKIERPVYQLASGFTFLGILFDDRGEHISPAKIAKAKEKIQRLMRRSIGADLNYLMENLNAAIRSWRYHYGNCQSDPVFRDLQLQIYQGLAGKIRDMRNRNQFERATLKRQLNRLQDLAILPSRQKEGILNRVLNGATDIHLTFQGDETKADQSATGVPVPAGNAQSAGKQQPAKTAEVSSEVRRKVRARARIYERHFAAEYDLVLNSNGTFLGKRSKRFMVRRPGHKDQYYPVNKVKHILVLSSSVTLSSAAVYLCAHNNIPIDYLDFAGKPYARLSAPEKPAWRYGMEQLMAEKNGKGQVLAAAFVCGKIRNQLNLLKYHSKYRRKADPDFMKLFEREADRIERYHLEAEELSRDLTLKTFRGSLFGIEGRAAAAYWRVVKDLVEDKVKFEKREHRGADDLFNSLLNYGYGILYSRVWGALMRAGLNVQISFLHAPQYQKPTLVFDVVEEFRAQVVDRVVLSLINRREKVVVKEGQLTQGSKNLLVENIFERLNTPESHRGKRRTLQEIIQYQASAIGKFLKGDEEDYRPYIAKW
ncbi:MAG: CRISPR-associated endonuclease Cas1 [Calditrichaeota bacterium]|nr:CRISPR-associated endonuclease Cas1 [Calditrichota bacterium]